MGEHALYNGRRIKVGTCEDMYYLRYSQASLVEAVDNSVDPVRDREELRFRFPWPNEDDMEPGEIDGELHRSVAVPGLTMPAFTEHGTVQFSATPGYLVSLPCPEGNQKGEGEHRIGRNGFAGALRIVQQKPSGADLLLVVMCGGCRAKVWLDWQGAEPIVLACLAQARNHRPDSAPYKWWHTITERITVGYGN